MPSKVDIAASSEPPRPVWTSDEGSMAQSTAKHRWAVIVDKMVDSMTTTLQSSELDSRSQNEGILIKQELRLLRQEIVTNAKMPPINLHGDPEEQWYNKRLGVCSHLAWQAAPWLFAECYLYRRVQALLSSSVCWNRYDIFQQQKTSTFTNSQTAVQDLAARYTRSLETEHCTNQPEELLFAQFFDMVSLSLWGNATDLSLLDRPSVEELRMLQEQGSNSAAQQRIVDNDVAEVWSYINSTAYQQSDRRIDIVLDNAGFELFTDVVFVLYLLDNDIARTVRLHTKAFPWFVSDATEADIGSLLDMLASPEIFPARDCVQPLLDRLRNVISQGKVVVTPHRFWTTGCSFWDMPERATDLLAELRESDLVIFKGDLNYRKLTGDGLWPYTTPFKTALRSLGAESGLKILALRTNKADVCVGVESDEQVSQLEAVCPDSGWVRNGKYGVISFSDGV